MAGLHGDHRLAVVIDWGADMEKILWVVKYANVQTFAKTAVQAGVAGVAIRTDNDLDTALQVFHDKGIKVYGWRWPSAQRDAAMRETDRVTTAFHHGLDGYYVDPEGQAGASYDWDQNGLASLADDFCTAIKQASGGKVFGVTSHFRANAIFPKLPWAAFFRHADLFLPQAYWRTENGPVGHAIPSENYLKAIQYWKAAGASGSRIVPMAGELASVSPSEIAEYAHTAAQQNVDQLHFYTCETSVKPAVWDAIAGLKT